MALEASASDLFRLVLGDGMGPVIVGAVFGFPGAYAVSSLIRSFLFDTATADPATYLMTVFLLVTFALFACAIPAIKAIRRDFDANRNGTNTS